VIFRNSQRGLSNCRLEHRAATRPDRLPIGVLQRKGGVAATLVALGLTGTCLVGAPAHADPDLLDAASSAANGTVLLFDELGEQLNVNFDNTIAFLDFFQPEIQDGNDIPTWVWNGVVELCNLVC
jgi:hypothetical protein